MDESEVKRRVEDIRGMAADFEAAHSAEDSLYFDVLRAIADGTCSDAKACALAALQTVDIDFARYCA